jgi:hypothetical protein
MQLIKMSLGVSLSFIKPFELCLSFSIHGVGVIFGKVSDLSEIDPTIAQEVIEANRRCSLTGEGSIYGQLLTIGYSEYRQHDKKWVSYGYCNNKFLLKRRLVVLTCYLPF